MPLEHPDGRVDTGLLQYCGKGEGGVQAGAQPALQHLRRGANLLTIVPPARGWFGVADVAGLHAVEHCSDDRVHPLWVLALIAVDGRVPGGLREAIRDLEHQGCDGRRVGLHVGSQDFQCQLWRGCLPLVGGEDGHVLGRLAEHLPRAVAQHHPNSAGALLVDIEHRRRVQLEVDRAQHCGPVDGEVEVDLARAAVGAVGADHVDLDHRAPDAVCGAVDDDALNNRNPAMRHGIAEVGHSGDLNPRPDSRHRNLSGAPDKRLGRQWPRFGGHRLLGGRPSLG